MRSSREWHFTESLLNHVGRAAFPAQIGRELLVGDDQEVGTKALGQLPQRIIRASNDWAANNNDGFETPDRKRSTSSRSRS